MTLPYLTTEKTVDPMPFFGFDATNSLSEANFVAPYKLIGLDALSVDNATQLFTPASRQASMRVMAPRTLVYTHSDGLYSAVGTIFVAAA